MTVGNEEYGSWEADTIPQKQRVYLRCRGSRVRPGYYDLIKAASPSTLVGVDVDEDNSTGGWDKTVSATRRDTTTSWNTTIIPKRQAPKAIPSSCIRRTGANNEHQHHKVGTDEVGNSRHAHLTSEKSGDRQ